jgi:arsenate reductase (thioredoxin)
MAEGFAKTYGADVIEATSAGLAPAISIAPMTRQVMLEKNIDIGDAFPKGVGMVIPGGIDLIVNMSGHKLPAKTAAPVEDWEVRDPIGQSEAVYRKTRDEIERRIMTLILSIRKREAAEQESDTRVDTRRRRPRQ